GGVINPGNVTIEAAPGVIANIDAVLQGDPAGGNALRQGSNGITVAYSSAFRVVTLRNLVIRNFNNGILVAGIARVNIDNCRLENNIANNISLIDNANVAITNTQSVGAGLRIGPSVPTAPNPGYGLVLRNNARANVMNSSFTNNQGAGLVNLTNDATNLKLFKVGAFFNGTDIAGPFTVAPDPNYATTN
ncbi:MAG TPA: right-handed parallel beta-helix repeat-containing protein, partial [Pyrinomonadaceae bacterium]|nr:right-handed parallel beta-helix repeat-containing protein [Pyrinomonadaceae bacterium]